MATLTFAGTTIWSDAATGIGRVQESLEGARVRWSVEALPRDDGKIAKHLGIDPGRFTVTADFLLASNEVSSLNNTVVGLVEKYGTVATPRQSVSNCILLGFELVDLRSHELKASDLSTIRYRYRLNLFFERLE